LSYGRTATRADEDRTLARHHAQTGWPRH